MILPSDASRASESPWMGALERALEGVPEPRVDPLSPLAALDELIALESSAPPAAAMDRASLARDIAAALEALGAAVEAAVPIALSDFRKHTLARLAELVATSEGIEIAASAARVLRDRLTAETAVAAAWRDVVAAFRGGEEREERHHTVVCLRELIERRGHVWELDGLVLAGVLRDRASEVKHVRAELDPSVAAASATDSRAEDRRRAGLSEIERLELAERYLARPPKDEDAVVWLAVQHASVSGGVMELRSVRFIGVEALDDHELEPPFEFAPVGMSPEEAARELAGVRRRLRHGMPEGVVFARVHTTTRGGDPVERARRLVTGLLDAAMLRRRTFSFHRRGIVAESGWSVDVRTWRLVDGHVLVSPTGWSGAGQVGTGETDIVFASDDPISSVLPLLDPDVAVALEAGRRDAVDALELIRWERVLDDAPDDVVRVALGVRNLERALRPERVPGRGGRAGHWTDVATYYLRDMWCWRSAGAEFIPLSTSPDWPTGDVVEQWLAFLDEEFDTLLARAARQRNAAVHGAMTAPAVIASVVAFIASLGQCILLAAVTAVAEERSLAEWLEDRRLLLRERRAALATRPVSAELRTWLDDAVPGGERR